MKKGSGERKPECQLLISHSLYPCFVRGAYTTTSETTCQEREPGAFQLISAGYTLVLVLLFRLPTSSQDPNRIDWLINKLRQGPPAWLAPLQCGCLKPDRGQLAPEGEFPLDTWRGIYSASELCPTSLPKIDRCPARVGV